MVRALILLALLGSSVAVKPKIIASGRGAPDSVSIVNARVRFRQLHLPLQLNELKNGPLVDGISHKGAEVRYRLTNGHAKGRISYGGIFEVWLDEVKWVDDSHVLLSITDFSAGGSSSELGYVQVAKLEGDWLTIVQEIEFDAAESPL